MGYLYSYVILPFLGGCSSKFVAILFQVCNDCILAHSCLFIVERGSIRAVVFGEHFVAGRMSSWELQL